MVALDLNVEALFDGVAPDNDEKVCVPVVFKEMDVEISQTFKEAESYLIVDFLYRKVEELDPQEMVGLFSSSEDGLKELGLSAVICRDIFPMALKIFNDVGITSFIPVDKDIVNNVQRFANNELLPTESAAAVGGCLSGCSSCSSTCSTK